MQLGFFAKYHPKVMKMNIHLENESKATAS